MFFMCVQGLKTLNKGVEREPFSNWAPFLHGHMTSSPGGPLNTQIWQSNSAQSLHTYVHCNRFLSSTSSFKLSQNKVLDKKKNKKKKEQQIAILLLAGFIP